MLEALREVEDALVGFLRAKEQVVFLGDSVKAAQRSVDLALLQYRDGVADYQRVLDTQQALVAQQDLLTSRKGDISTNLIDMYRALGGGWEIRVGQDFVPVETKAIMAERTNWGELLESGAEEIPESEKAKTFRKLDW